MEKEVDMKSSTLRASFLLICLVVFAANALSQPDAKQLKSGAERVNAASDVINEIMAADDKSIPRDLLSKAKAIIVFPGTLKGGFIVGAQGGKGLAISRLKTGWSAPAFFNLGGGSVGFQIGGSSTDYIMVVMNDKGLRGLLEDQFELGGEASVAGGPVGRTAAASTNATMDAEILTYSRSKGAFAGVSLKGVVITPDKKMNKGIYQKTAKQVLVEAPVAWDAGPKSLQKFPMTVASYAK